MPELLPVHGFVLAGGKSVRMGRDKALLPFRGRPMIEIAVEKLRGFCADVCIAGNRDDLAAFAPIVYETRVDCGPAAGIEAGLRATTQPWAMFVPVDVPLVPQELLRRWANALVMQRASGCSASFLAIGASEQPAFCAIAADRSPNVAEALQDGERSVRNLLWALEQGSEGGWLWVCEVEDLAQDLLHPEFPNLQTENWFRNINTPDELIDAAAGCGPE